MNLMKALMHSHRVCVNWFGNFQYFTTQDHHVIYQGKNQQLVTHTSSVVVILFNWSLKVKQTK